MSIEKRFDQKLQGIPMPQIDVRDQVMASIRSGSREEVLTSLRTGTATGIRTGTRAGSWMRTRTKSQLVAVSVLAFLLLTGFASAAIISLQNAEGETIFSMRPFAQDDKPFDLPEEIVQQYMAGLAPGEAVAIYSPENNPQKIVTTRLQPAIYEDLTSLAASASAGGFAVPATLPAGVQFEEGTVTHAVGHPDVLQLIQESEANGGSIVSEKVPVLEQVEGISMVLTMAGEKYEVTMNSGSRWNNIVTDMNEVNGSRTILFGDAEALLVEKTQKQELIWRSGAAAGDVLYTVSTEGEGAGAEAGMLAILNALIQ